jgi:Fe-S cluster biogenesis protein NfuA
MCDCCGGKAAESNKITDMENFRMRVADAIEQVRPGLQMDGGDVKLVDVNDSGEVQVSLYGACAGCPHAQMTLKMGIERYLKETVPEVTSVSNVMEPEQMA